MYSQLDEDGSSVTHLTMPASTMSSEPDAPGCSIISSCFSAAGESSCYGWKPDFEFRQNNHSARRTNTTFYT